MHTGGEGRGSYSSRVSAAFTKEKSNRALWATKTRPLRYSTSSGSTASIGGIPATATSSMPVRWVIEGGIGRRGSTSVWKTPIRSPPRYVTAPTSVIAELGGGASGGLEVDDAERHVVQRDALVERSLKAIRVPHRRSLAGPRGGATVSNTCSRVKT